MRQQILRWSFQLVLACFVGAGLSIGLAMWAARHSDLGPSQNGTVLIKGQGRLPAQWARGFGIERWSINRSTTPRGSLWMPGPVTQFSAPNWMMLPAENDHSWLQSGEWIGVGWPRVSFTASRSFDLYKTGSSQSGWHGASVVNEGSLFQPFSAVVYPKIPVWSGLIINMIFFGFGSFVIMQALMVLHFVVRRTARKATGRCVGCGYALTGLPGPACPECGLQFVQEDQAFDDA